MSVDLTSSAQPNGWLWLIGIAITTIGTLAGVWLVARRRPSVRQTEPAAAQSAKEAVAEYRETFVVPLKAELAASRRAERACQERLAQRLSPSQRPRPSQEEGGPSD